MDKNFERKRRLPVDGDKVSKLAPRVSLALPAVPLKEVILIHEAVGGGVALDAANGIRASHAQDYSRENAGSQRNSQLVSWQGEDGNETKHSPCLMQA